MDFSRKGIIKYFLKKQFGKNTDVSRSTNNKWTTLQHNGVKFPEEYVQRDVPVVYNGKEILLSKEAEEVAFLYAKYVGSEYETNSTFKKNFFNDWKKILGKTTEIQSLDMCDFSKMKDYLENVKREKSEQKKAEKNVEKNIVEEDVEYKKVFIDDKIETISNYKMEPPGLFIGRGKNPHMGKLKKRIYPEDVTLNIGKDAKIPEPPIGHKWGKIIHDRSVEWLASWKENITGKTKYVWLSPDSDMKGNNDQKKFDVAKKLKKKIKTIVEENESNMKNGDEKMKQIATSLYFIDKLAIRVGNEKGEDETDTVGVTNLRVEHISLGENNSVKLSFLGKDSVPYENTINVDDVVYNNIIDFLKNKEKDDQVFDKINSNDVNKYLQSFMKDLTAKVFRTYNASNLFQKELKKINNKFEGVEKTEQTKKIILDEFAKANAKVAKMMNHQKNVNSGYKKQVDKINDVVDKLKKKLSKARRSTKKNTATIAKIKEKIKSYKSKKELVKEMKNISLNTSKANYIDPRLVVSFMKKNQLDVNKIFSKALQKKFNWAFSIDENYKF